MKTPAQGAYNRWKNYAEAICWDGMSLSDAIARSRELSELWHEYTRLARRETWVGRCDRCFFATADENAFDLHVRAHR